MRQIGVGLGHLPVQRLCHLPIGWMALGLAAIALGDLANDFLSSGMASGVAAGVAFHALNFVIGVVGPVIQSARLHYVEFFSQFFEPAMVRYRPLVGYRPLAGPEGT